MGQEEILQIDLDRIIINKSPKFYNRIPKFILRFLKKKVHVDELNEILRYCGHTTGVDFMSKALEYFNISFDVKGLDNIPTNSRYVFASNHPLGGLDGICLSKVVGDKFDKKIKYIVNDLLLNLTPLQNIFVPVNKHGLQSKGAISSQSEAFESENQIITFPAGLCSRKQNGKIEDLEWKKTFITKAIATKRDIVPVHFEAANSNFFYRFANIRKMLGIKLNIEMFFLPDEMFKCKNQRYSITFGKPIPYTFFDNSKSQKEWAEYVKKESYKLV